MTTTDLIRILKQNEFGGASGRPREISFVTEAGYIFEPDIVVDSTGDGLVTEICLRLIGEVEPIEDDEEEPDANGGG